MDGHVLLVSVILNFTCVHSFVTGTKCPELSMCSCVENKYSEVEVDCHDVEGIETKMCSVCEKIGNITSLDVRNSAISDIPSDCFNGCSKLKKLNLASNMIRKLAKNAFNSLITLEYLNINDNMLLQSSELSNFETFKTLEKLNHLSMRKNSRPNNMTTYSICRLCGFLRNVSALDLSENIMNHVPPSCFKECSNLQELYLESNNISQADNTSFSGLAELKVLNLDNNRVIVEGDVSHPNLFEPLHSLRELHIQKNTDIKNESKSFTYLANIGNKSFNNLQSLFLDGLPNGVLGQQFETFKQLSNLNFSGESSNCYIYSLTNLTFRNIFSKSLKFLHLSHCNISAIYAGTFTPLSELKYLNLSFNMALGFPPLRNVSYGLQFTKIEVLDYSKVYKAFGLTTQITRCDLEFLQNTTLQEIHINNNRLTSVEINAFMWLPKSLEIVYAEENQIEFGNYAFQLGCICNLKHIELSGQGKVAVYVTNYYSECGIKENHEDTSGGCHINRSVCAKCRSPLEECPNNRNISTIAIPDKLETVHVRNSNLHSEPSRLDKPLQIENNLKSLDISNNVFHSWTEPMILVNNLGLLNLSNNFGSNISLEFFTNCPNLEHLDASNNRIGPELAKDVDGGIFRNLKCLKYLNISNNWIEYLPFQLFKYTTSLRHLDLSFNRLKAVSFKYEHMDNLSHLCLQSNRLSTVPVPLLKQIENNLNRNSDIIGIDLTNNVLDGSCKNIEFLSWLTDHKDFFPNIDDYQFLKDDGEIMSFMEMSRSFEVFEKHCRNYTSIYIVSVCFILIFICVTVGGIIHRYRWRIRYLYYMAKARYGGYVPVRGNKAYDNYKYDIFVSYANDDYRFVTVEMYNTLDAAAVSMCLHQKDFLPGSYIAENILRAIKSSRKTVIVLSPAFLDSKWCMYEFNIARMEGIYGRDGESIIFVVMYEEIDISRISGEIRECLETESYLAYPKEEEERPYFWEMLTRALTDHGID